jgi:4-hydroxy-tetrahydrodipicolinate reductase
MRILLSGFGKMGKEIKKLAESRKHQIVGISNSNNPTTTINLENIDVVIDFSTPNTAFKNIKYSLNNNVPIVSGTTGWTEEIENVKELCRVNKGAFLYSSNFSIGMNIFQKLNQQLALHMKNYDYKIELNETHHKTKIDAPSGTAKQLINDIKEINNTNVNVNVERIGNINGIHNIIYKSQYDEIRIEHIAHNRNGFVEGVLLASEWIIGKKGFFNMHNVLTNKY